MKYIRLFENFEEGHKFDILDLFLIDSSYVKLMFFKEIQKLNYDLESIQTILDSGLVNIDDTDYWGNTALIYATKSYNLELIKFLISNGADTNASNSIDLLSPLHEAAYSGFVKAVQFLISSGANPNVKDRKQWTPLHLAAQRTDKNHMEIVEILIESGADLYAKTTSNITPLDLVNSEEMQNVFEKYKKKEAHSQI